MNIERTFPYLNTQMTLSNEKRKRNFCKIKEKTRKEKKQGKNYDHWTNISIHKHTNDASKWKEEKETSAKLKKNP